MVACHPWQPPFRPSLRNVKNRLARFFVLGLAASGTDTLHQLRRCNVIAPLQPVASRGAAQPVAGLVVCL